MNPIRTVLLVDDEAYFRRFVGAVLQQNGVTNVTESKDGAEAGVVLASVKPDLVILDINMPRVDGVSALQRIRQALPEIPIVMLTSISEESVVEQCVDLGASHFIRKDVPADLLQREIVEMLHLFGPDSAHEKS